MRKSNPVWFAMLPLLAGAFACTHHKAVTPSYSPQVTTGLQAGSICPAGQVVAVYAVNQSPEGSSAGKTSAGVHTFLYEFASDPALALKQGLEQSLQAGGCRLGAPAVANLVVTILRLEAKGLECGFFSCDGSGQSTVQVTLSDGARRVLLQTLVSSTSTKGCGMAVCNEAEASEIASNVLTDTIRKTIATVAGHIARTGGSEAPMVPMPPAPPGPPVPQS
jgi:hypothetical protein